MEALEAICDPDLPYFIDLDLIVSFDPDLLIPTEDGQELVKNFDGLVSNLEDNTNIVIGSDHSWHPPDDEAYLSASHAQTESEDQFDPTLN